MGWFRLIVDMLNKRFCCELDLCIYVNWILKLDYFTLHPRCQYATILIYYHEACFGV